VNLGGHFDLDNKNKRIDEINTELSKDGIWDDVDRANALNKELSDIQKSVDGYNSLYKRVVENLELINIGLDEDMLREISMDITILESEYDKLMISSLLSGEYDSSNCYLEIHPGAGGTEACDWASIVL